MPVITPSSGARGVVSTFALRALAVPFEEQVGEGATDIDCQTCFFHELYAAVCWMLPPR